jgi:hypothetical protein
MAKLFSRSCWQFYFKDKLKQLGYLAGLMVLAGLVVVTTNLQFHSSKRLKKLSQVCVYTPCKLNHLSLRTLLKGRSLGIMMLWPSLSTVALVTTNLLDNRHFYLKYQLLLMVLLPNRALLAATKYQTLVLIYP